MKYQNLEGIRFGRLVAVSCASSNSNGCAQWLCKCDCGKYKTTIASRLKLGTTKSCGCYQLEVSRSIRTTHGESLRTDSCTSEYVAWHSMRQRCRDKNHKFYRHYGGRGIAVCDRWISSYENFLADMGRKPTPNHSLDRINNGAIIRQKTADGRPAQNSPLISATIVLLPSKMFQKPSWNGLINTIFPGQL